MEKYRDFEENHYFQNLLSENISFIFLNLFIEKNKKLPFRTLHIETKDAYFIQDDLFMEFHYSLHLKGALTNATSCTQYRFYCYY